jgi:hypothetical protein
LDCGFRLFDVRDECGVAEMTGNGLTRTASIAGIKLRFNQSDSASRWIVGALLVGLLAFFSIAVADDVPRDEAGFTDFVATQLRKQLVDADVVVKAPLTVAVGGLQVNLDRIFTFCRGNPPGCSPQIDNYVSGAVEAYRVQNAAPTKQAVRLVVKTAEYVQTVQSAPPGSKPLQMQPRPFVEGLYVLPVLDSPRTIRLMAEGDNGKLGLTLDEVFALGAENLKKELAPLMDVAKVTTQGKIGQLVGSVFNPSRMILLDSWAPLAQAQGGVLIIAIPATDAVFYVGEDTRPAIDALRALVKNVLSQVPNKLSGDLYRWRASGWERITP